MKSKSTVVGYLMSAISSTDLSLSSSSSKSALRIGRYLLMRLAVVGVTLAVGVYIAVVVANLGGYIDAIIRDRINSGIMGMLMGGWLSDVKDQTQRNEIIEQTRLQMEDAAGLNQPFLLRCARWLYQNLTFQMLDTQIKESYPNTLLLFGTASLLLFFSCLFLAMLLSRNYGSLLDRLVVSLSPISSMPSWVHGVLLVMIFAVQLHWLPYNVNISPFNRIIEQLTTDFNPGYLWLILRYMLLPVAAVFLSMFFQVTYTWRTFFLIYSHEDYVEVARAKGLPDKVLERQYILRPTLPYIVTNFALILISFWQTSMALEYFFFWPGIGTLYIKSIRLVAYNPNVVMGIVTIFAYLLAITVFVLDIVYVLVDPRVRIQGQQEARTGRVSLKSRWRNFLQRRKSSKPPLVAGTHQQVEPLEVSSETAPQRRISKRGGWLEQLAPAFREAFRYPSAIIGVAGIALMVIVSIYTVIALPYQEVKKLWVSDTWMNNPENALPVWANFFLIKKLPKSIQLSSLDGTAEKITEVLDQDTTDVQLIYGFDYPYGDFPQDIIVAFDATYQEKHPFVSMAWYTPDGREIKLGSVSITSSTRIYFSQDSKITRRVGNMLPQKGLFIDPAGDPETPLRGHYELRISGITFEKDASLDASVNVMGKVFGAAGTDHRRRDLAIALLWGTPVALALGFFGAVCTTVISILVAAVGVWFGGSVDSLVQAITEVNIMLPIFPISVMAYFLYGKHVWLVIGAIIVFSILGTSTKNYRAAFLQVKDSPFIEAAQSYGAPNWRIISRYMVPRILPVMVPQLVAMVPGYVFLEATLAIFGVSDAYIPTWGTTIYDALVNGAFRGYYYWILEPIFLLMVTGLAFALLGFALDRVFNPRLRSL